MKILLVNVIYGIGSTGKIVLSLANEYKKLGHDVRIIYGRYSSVNDEMSQKYTSSLGSKIHHATSNIKGNMYGGMSLSTKRIISAIKKMNPDIVHLHCINGYFVNIYSLLNFLKENNIRTVLTNHADFMFTGGCGYALDCNQYLNNECRNCSNAKCIAKYSYNHYNKLKNIFSDFDNLAIVGVSPYQTDKAGNSVIQQNNKHYFVSNPIDNIFFSEAKNNPYKTKNNILHITPNFNNPEKGGKQIFEIAKNLPNYNFYVISSLPVQITTKLKNIYFLPPIKDIHVLHEYYHFADASLMLSKQETFSMITAESLASGTPVIGFKAGGPETIGLANYSFFFEQGDIEGVINKIKELSSYDKNQITKEAKDKYESSKIAKQYLGIYKTLIKPQQNKTKKILHIVESFELGGTETFIINYAKALSSKGYIFDIYASGNISKPQEDEIKECGGTIYKGSNPSLKNRNLVIKEFKQFLKHNHYDVIHTDINFDGEPYLKAAKQIGIPTRICHSHDDVRNVKISLLKKWQYSLQLKSIKKNATHFLACSTEAGISIFGKKFFYENGSVIKNIIDPDKYLIKNDDRINALKDSFFDDASIILGNISRFEDKKNQSFILDVFSKLLKENPHAKLVLGGPDGGNLNQIQEKAKQLGIEKSVKFIGPRDDVNDWLHIFDIYLFPSLFEGFGIIGLESQIAGTQVLASTNVPKAIDLGVGLVDYLDLDINIWINKIKQYTPNNISSESIKKALDDKGFVNVDSLMKIYNN